MDWLTVRLDKIDSLGELAMFFTFAVAVGLAVWYIFNKKKFDAVEKLDERTILSYKERLLIVEKETKTCHEQHEETKQMVRHLQGQLDAYSKMVLIPADFIKDIQRNQKEIIKLLKGGNGKS